jgi:alkanesulfonate monooxygenase SsuD/methylene tetrahydromethanopterin reductase-like flavin-dependent oxidoreductase (luciferase family)
LDFGVHLPVIDFSGQGFSLERLRTYVQTARELGFPALSANDRLVFSRPWIDSLAALTAVLSHAGDMAIGTSGLLPVVRGPIPVAKAVAAIDVLSQGRFFAGMAPGSSVQDYNAVGIDWRERWKRFDEAIQLIRSIWSAEHSGFAGRFYSIPAIDVLPKPVQQPSPPIWIGSWGSDAGLRRVARLGDGWLASAYNTLPDQFASAREKLLAALNDNGKDPEVFPNALVTMFTYVTEDKSRAESMLAMLSAVLNRPTDELRRRLLVGSPASCAERLVAYNAVCVQRVFIWPAADELTQLAAFQSRVAPLVRT